MNRTVRTAAITLLVAATAGALAVVIVRGQIHRHRRDLFSPRPFRRLAALGHIGGEPASVDAIRLLRDFIAWEPRKLLRERARSIVDRMTAEVGQLQIDFGGESA